MQAYELARRGDRHNWDSYLHKYDRREPQLGGTLPLATSSYVVVGGKPCSQRTARRLVDRTP